MPRGPAKQIPCWTEGEAWQETDGRKQTRGNVKKIRRLDRPRGSPRGVLSLDTAEFSRLFLLDCFFFRALLCGLDLRWGSDGTRQARHEFGRGNNKTVLTHARYYRALMECCSSINALLLRPTEAEK